MTDIERRAAETEYYREVYRVGGYVMKPMRFEATATDLYHIPCRGSYLDIGCGMGAMLAEAKRIGFLPVLGTEVVPKLIDGVRVIFAEAHNLPLDRASFDVVTMFDVMEHLVPGDDEAACREIARVMRRHALISVSNKESIWLGRDAHINKRPYPEWDALFREWFVGFRVTWMQPTPPGASPRWRIDKLT